MPGSDRDSDGKLIHSFINQRNKIIELENLHKFFKIGSEPQSQLQMWKNIPAVK